MVEARVYAMLSDVLAVVGVVVDVVVELFDVLSDLFSDEDFSVPAMQVFLLMLMNSICLLLGRFKLGLLVSYCFAFYWGFVFNKDYFVGLHAVTPASLAVYAAGGMAMLVVAVIGFLRDP
jgi:hypothetical protein